VVTVVVVVVVVVWAETALTMNKKGKRSNFMGAFILADSKFRFATDVLRSALVAMVVMLCGVTSQRFGLREGKRQVFNLCLFITAKVKRA
jgi:prolipoprotein diacylglyceryltransferase